MSGLDRAGDSLDAIPDVPRRETAAEVDRGTILTEARARREFALAYRATVDAVYAQAELDAGARRPGDSQVTDYAAAGPAARGACENVAPGRGRQTRAPVTESMQ